MVEEFEFRLCPYYYSFLPSETIQYHFSTCYRGRLLAGIYLPGVPLRFTPGYQNYAAMRLNTGLVQRLPELHCPEPVEGSKGILST